MLYVSDAFTSIHRPFSITHPFEYIFIDIYALDAFLSIDGPLCITYPECCIFIDALCIRCICIHSWTFFHNSSFRIHLFRYLCIGYISMHLTTFMHNLSWLVHRYRYFMHADAYPSIYGSLCITYPDWCIVIAALCIRCISIHWCTFMHNLSWMLHLYRCLCIICICIHSWTFMHNLS